jgi:hypothetical protein
LGGHDKNHHYFAFTEERKLMFISSAKLIRGLFIVLVPFIVLTIVMLFAKGAVKFFPFFAIPECGNSKFVDDFDDYADRAVIAYVCEETLGNFIFFTLMFMTRFVEDEFAITREFRSMTFWRFFTSTLYLLSLCFFPTSVFTMLGCPEYFQVMLCIGLLFDSSIR